VLASLKKNAAGRSAPQGSIKHVPAPRCAGAMLEWSWSKSGLASVGNVALAAASR